MKPSHFQLPVGRPWSMDRYGFHFYSAVGLAWDGFLHSLFARA